MDSIHTGRYEKEIVIFNIWLSLLVYIDIWLLYALYRYYKYMLDKYHYIYYIKP
jgi:hypothetical protein